MTVTVTIEQWRRAQKLNEFFAPLDLELLDNLTQASPAEDDRVAGTILAAAIGDALGHPTEFLRTQQIRQRYGPAGVTGFELYWERGGQRFAPYTDDTQMAEAVLRCLLWSRSTGASLDATMDQLGQRFVAWAYAPQGGHRSPGNACLAGSRCLSEGARWNEAGAPDAGGCGSVMRAYPFGIIFRNDLAQAEHWAVEHSRLTHGADIALAACAAMAVGVASLLRDATPELALQAMHAAAARWDSETADMLATAVDNAKAGVAPEQELTRLQGWAAHDAICAAAYVFTRHTSDTRAALLEGANADGDSDSVATLAGALCGAYGGLEKIPTDWVTDVERSQELRRLARAASATLMGFSFTAVKP